jgi:ubiquitin-conjugating enzyme E2 O
MVPICVQDLFSVLIDGPIRTPYEDGVFVFDVMLPYDYPNNPPMLHYLSYASDRLNPNLYVDGKVCVSLLGTWSGKVHSQVLLLTMFTWYAHTKPVKI